MSAPLHIVELDSCASTSTELAAMPQAPSGTVVATRCQTAGRGQRGNSWESEPGANLTFSLLLRPESISAQRQFEMSMLVSLAIVGVIDRLLPPYARAHIKWPNDIYVDDRKICGILIENSLSGSRIDRAIVGVGLNVNQTVFLSDAPNPVSLASVTGRRTLLGPLLREVAAAILDAVGSYVPDRDAAVLKSRYMSELWRCDGARYPFIDVASGERFNASIEDVAADGTLTLLAAEPRKYLFKEVVFVL